MSNRVAVEDQNSKALGTSVIRNMLIAMQSFYRFYY